MIKLNKILILFLSLLLCLPVHSFAKEGGGNKKLRKITGTPNWTKLNINNVSTYFRSNGDSDLDNNANSGFVFPKGSGKTVFYESGFLWGASVNGGEVRVGGSAYSSGLQPGKILSPGVAEDPNLDKNRIYRVRPDYKTANLRGEAADEGISEAEVFAQYETDWNEWPATDGAPYEDVDGNGSYDATIDIPGVPGASQTIWFVSNDLDGGLTQKLYGSTPMGIEMQSTIWAYSQAGPLGNMLFRKYLIINKSNDILNDMYVTMWSDPDVGNATDDFAGCDTTLSLGYAFNAAATDATYGETPPPAGGFDFFQGPVVDAPGDSAIFKGQRVYDKKNLPMTAFYYFARGDLAVVDPTTESYEGTTQFYNFMQGKIGKTGEYFKTPAALGAKSTTFALSGDPVTGEGWIDGQILASGDRRIGCASGPFTMMPGDEQEIVVAQIAAIGADRLSSVALLKNYDIVAQDAYNNFFKIPTGAAPPNVTATEMDEAVILNWGNPTTAAKTESYNERGYKFQGYNVYQLVSSSGSKESGKLVATFDIADGNSTLYDYLFDQRTGKDELVPVQFGTDSGLERSINISQDYLRSGESLKNGSRYYYAVTSYSYNEDPLAVPHVLENPLSIVTVTPHSDNPGVRYQTTYGAEITEISHTSSGKKGDGEIKVYVQDPVKMNGHSYKVDFASSGGQTVWNLRDVTNGSVLLADQTNQSGDDKYYIVDGFLLKVLGPPPGVKDWDIPAGTRRFTFAGGADGFHFEGFEGALGWTSPREVFGDGVQLVGAAETKTVLLKLASVNFEGDYNPPFNASDENMSYGYRFLRGSTADPAKPEFAPFILNQAGGYSFQEFTKNVPLSAWDVEDPENPKRLAIGFMENNAAGGLVDGKYWPGDYNFYDNYATGGPREWLFIFDAPYSESMDPVLAEEITSSNARVMYWATWARRGPVPFSPDATGEDQFIIYQNRILTPADVFTFTLPSVTTDAELAKQDIEKVNVFPNPYYGANPQELNKYQRFVTFNHLPQEAVIRIFNLAGEQIRLIRKDNDSQFQRWELTNDSGLPVGSGLYIAYIDMPNLGTKILKFTVIQEQQILDRF